MTSAALLPALLADAGILAVAGGVKLARPAAAADFLASLGLPRSATLIRAAACVELAAGVGALRWPGQAAAAIAALFALFSVVVAVQLRRSSAVPCGCLGSREIPPSRVHLALNAVCAAVAVAAAVAPPPAYSGFAGSDPLAAAVALLAALAVAGLAQAALVLLPGTLGAWEGGWT